MRKLRESKSFKTVTVFIAFNLVFQLVFPTVSFALTSGPAQEEFASFEPASTTDMVDLYSGDFTYNIPLLSVPGPNGGYPVNLSYHSGVGMEQEASWVGLGWNINVGAINRQLRGLPDDFNGDEIAYDYDFKENVTVGINGPDVSNAPFIWETFGFPVTGVVNPSLFQWQIYYNNYKGLGYRIMLDVTPETSNKFGLGLGLTLDSQGGLGIAPSISMGAQFGDVNGGVSGKLSANINNRQGLTDLGFSGMLNVKTNVGLKKNGLKGFGTGSSISFGTNHSVPEVAIPFTTTSIPFNTSLATSPSPYYFGEYSSFFPNGWKGYVNTTTLKNGGIVTAPAYGYLNTQNASVNDVKDFTRNPLEHSKKVPNLAASNYTYDLFTYTGQGAAGMFRPYRSTVDVLTDQNRVNKSKTKQINAEFGISSSGAITNIHTGFGFPNEKSESHSGAWKDGNDLNIGTPSNNVGYEYAYFQEYGEKTGISAQNPQENQLLNWEGDQAVRLDVKKTGGWANRSFSVDDDYVQNSSGAIASVLNDEYSKRSNNTREKRAKVINKLTALEAYKYGFSKDLVYFEGEGTQPKFSAIPTGSKAQHISEIEVIEPDGMRYYYGLPAYNNTQIDETMATAVSSTNGTTPVTATTNSGTTNEYRKKTTLPAYVHSWMLTAVTSADYIDKTGDGPTEDDLGYYTKFNYQKKHDNYKWRLPYIDGAYMEGTNSSDDNMVGYTYGEKEIYYLHSIETKTHIAEFKSRDRSDGLSARGQYADSPGSQKLEKLENIKLFSKAELANAATPTPIKTVNFNYDNSLCQGIPNGSQGKLTLKGLNFTYENSSRGSLSPYEFHYENSNPDYDRMAMDRWGKYKNLSSYSGTYPSEIFPYNDQNVADAAPWDLTRIELPTGGTLNIDYEEDDYSYVEGEKPMKMFDIIGVDENSTPTALSTRFGTQTFDDFDGYRVYFALEDGPTLNSQSTPVSQAFANDHVKEHYFNNSSLKKMWFKTLIDIKDGNKDFVTGYANIDYSQTFGLLDIGSTGYYNAGYFYVQKEKLSATGGSVHPFRKAAFQYLQMARPELLYGSSPVTSVTGLLGSVITNIADLTSMITGYNNFCYLAQYGKTIYFGGESIVKLYDEDQIKQGGGSRVKQLTIDDNWDNNEDGAKENSSYGQAYSYSLPDGLSSGVAYEPRIGGEESVLRKPVNYSESTFLASTKNLFVEQPILESYYPGASVGYSHVTVKSIAPQIAVADNSSNDLLLTSAPITAYEFYTAKDFPIWTDQTDLSNDPDIVRPFIVPGIYTNYKKKRARSQGYSIVLNDMAGKPKAITQKTRPNINNLAGTIISKEEYVYQTTSPYDASNANHLDNKVKTLNQNGTYTESIIGQSHDIFIDMNENRMKSSSKHVDFNIDLSIIPAPFPLFMIVPLPYWGDVELSTKTAVTNKVIYRTGILKEVITTTDESVIKQANLAYDINTGSPLLTQVTNEYKDPIYTHNIPAHWYYSGMEGAYQNIGYTATVVSSSPSFVVVPDASMFHLGDEVGIEPSGERVFVISRNIATNQLFFHSHIGYLPPNTTNTTQIKVLRSGHRNMLTANVGSVVSKSWDFKSIAPTNLEDLYADAFGNSQVIDANAVEFKENWQKSPGCDEGTVGSIVYTKYASGSLGNWRMYKSHKFNSDRLYATVNGNKTDGVYNTFEQFDWFNPTTNPAWILANEVTRYSPYGFEVENRDALNNYSSARYGYRDALNTAVAYNARQFEIGTVNFEEDFDASCNSKHHPFEFPGLFSNTEAHTGKRSLRIPPLSFITNSFTVLSAGTGLLQNGYQPTETADLKLIAGEKYIISAWVKENSDGNEQGLMTYSSPLIEVFFNANPINPTSYSFSAKNEIIEGWQRIEGEIEIPIGVNGIIIHLVSESNSQDIFFDDIRIQPADANMKTFVYDNVSLKLAAELDENNYATFYIYDEQGALSKVKKETENGIVTISEGRSSNVKQQ